jgi:DNA mismatch endonuclease (patch repair protein)
MNRSTRSGIPKASSELTRLRMVGQRRRDTAPEMEIRRRLHALGFRFRVDRRPVADLRRRADIVFGAARVAVFIDGCFWHGCPSHVRWPKANARWWRVKIESNVARDRDTDQRLNEAGWHVVRIWEHEPGEDAVQSIAAALAGRRVAAASSTPPGK